MIYINVYKHSETIKKVPLEKNCSNKSSVSIIFNETQSYFCTIRLEMRMNMRHLFFEHLQIDKAKNVVLLGEEKLYYYFYKYF